MEGGRTPAVKHLGRCDLPACNPTTAGSMSGVDVSCMVRQNSPQYVVLKEETKRRRFGRNRHGVVKASGLLFRSFCYAFVFQLFGPFGRAMGERGETQALDGSSQSSPADGIRNISVLGDATYVQSAWSACVKTHLVSKRRSTTKRRRTSVRETHNAPGSIYLSALPPTSSSSKQEVADARATPRPPRHA
jgi:hypothetical protein